MFDPTEIISISTILALILFAFVFWKDSTLEGFSSDKILDAFFLILIGGLVGGKILFRPIDFAYLRYELLSSPLILEGVLVGGGIMTWYIVYKNKWSGWKIGDMIAPALSLFQAIIFLGVWVVSQRYSDLIIFVSFFTLYVIIRYLKNKKSIGRSSLFFERKRLNKIVYNGALLSIYLTVSSLIAILFLLAYLNYESWFWWFQFLFYVSVFTVALVLIRKQIQTQKNIMSLKDYVKKINIVDILRKRNAEISKQEQILKKEDPFLVENANEGGRRIDESGDEVLELNLHNDVERGKSILSSEKKEVKEALDKVKQGTYGICENCGKSISKERLKAYPTAKYCIDCGQKFEK